MGEARPWAATETSATLRPGTVDTAPIDKLVMRHLLLAEPDLANNRDQIVFHDKLPAEKDYPEGKTRVKLLKTLASAILPIKKNKLIRRLRSALNRPAHLTRHSVRGLWEMQNRERIRLWTEMSQVKGLLQLLMMQRNGYRWSEADRLTIRVQLRKLASLSPYLVLFVSPGGFLALPALAWWLDRRRQKRLEHVRQTTR
jgi:hypothetical protein